MRTRVFACLSLLTLCAGFLPTHAEDSPQWQGVDRTGVSREKGLLQEWPKGGPPLLWKATGLGGGYCTPSVANGRIFGMSYRGEEKKQEEFVWALDEKNEGKELWAVKIAKATGVGYGEGSRSTPTVDGDLLYAVGVDGDLVCLEVASGKEVWHKNYKADFKGERQGWGYCESVLIDGDKVICTPGGKDASLAALNKKTGEVIWKSVVRPEATADPDKAQYASIIVADVDGVRQYIQFMRKGVVSVAAADGKFLWRYNHPANGTANCSTPIYRDGQIFAASAYGTGGGAAKLTRDGADFKAEEVWFTKKIMNHHGGVVFLDGYLYGSNEGLLTCLDWKTGDVKWDDRNPGKGSITFADGRLYYRNEGGTLFLVEATPDKYVEKGKFPQPERSKKSAWSHPVIANGKLYILDQDLLLCYDIKQK